MNFKKEVPFDSVQGDIKSEINFPTYRKYKNNKNYFKIISNNEFDEISFIGSKAIVTKHIAKIFPDRNFIYDLLHDVGNTSELSSEEEFEKHLTTI
jgi:hypothetical protein